MNTGVGSLSLLQGIFPALELSWRHLHNIISLTIFFLNILNLDGVNITIRSVTQAGKLRFFLDSSALSSHHQVLLLTALNPQICLPFSFTFHFHLFENAS